MIDREKFDDTFQYFDKEVIPQLVTPDAFHTAMDRILIINYLI